MNQEIIDLKTFDLESEFNKIPEQMAFKIGDVADLIQVKPYVLRYWEQEFKALNPKKAVNNQRIYSRRDVETVILIKKFLYVDQFSIPGAIKALKEYRDQQHQQNKLTETVAHPKQNLNDPIDLLTEKYVKIDESISNLISKIRSVKGKLEHKFFQIGI